MILCDRPPIHSQSSSYHASSNYSSESQYLILNINVNIQHRTELQHRLKKRFHVVISGDRDSNLNTGVSAGSQRNQNYAHDKAPDDQLLLQQQQQQQQQPQLDDDRLVRPVNDIALTNSPTVDALVFLPARFTDFGGL